VFGKDKTLEFFNTTLGAVKETNSSAKYENTIELNNSNNNNSESENGSSLIEKESSKSNSVPSFGLLGSLICLYGGWKLRKK